ncbi:histone-lysine N-methyltransferase PRDM9-like [Periplaneta americana]|uniref:histone-lysine N-methyltransferase PRDM9-like n=1 Tax=Periplaneta americana TaxID=6978 RepID=UPI0037E7FA2F
MCKRKRKLQPEEYKFKKKKTQRTSELQNKWRHVPTYEELEADDGQDFVGFPEVDCVGKIVGLEFLTDAIKKLEDEIQGCEQTGSAPEEKIKTSSRRYPSRSIPRKDYTEGNVPDDDDYIFCDDCDQEWEGDCPFHGPLTVIEDVKVPANMKDPTRAERTVPPMLCIAQSGIRGAGCGVWTKQLLSKGLRFGPYEGAKVMSANTSGYCWQIRQNRRPVYCVDAKDCGLANWMRYVNCARHEGEQNLMAFQYKGQMYYRTFREIPPNNELLVWYGDDYGRELGIDVENYHKPQQEYNSAVFPCAQCGVTFSSPLYLERHSKYCKARRGKCVNSSSDANTEELAVNDNETSKTNKLYRHIFSKMNLQTSLKHNYETRISNLVPCKRKNTGEKPYKCSKCSYGSAHSSDLVSHMRTHTGEKPYKCSKCSYESAQSSALVRHMRTHTGEKPYKCSKCSYESAWSSALVVHMKTHTGEKPYKCSKCGYESALSSTLVNHMRTHTGEKPYKCSKCSYECAQSSALVSHMRTHTGEKPYKCSKCSYESAHSSDLVSHMRTHTGEKPYKCSKCSYESARSSNLVRHMRTHTGEKPYKCSKCSYDSARSSDLVSHMRTHTGEKPYKCSKSSSESN